MWGAGVADAGYHGKVGIVLFNHADDEFRVRQGDQISQLILGRRIKTPAVEVVNELDDTSRGAAGLGSTGKQLVPESNFGNDCSGNIRKQSTNEKSTKSKPQDPSESIL